jgi:hypothetical protein
MSIPKPPQGGGRRRATIIGLVVALLAVIGVAYGVGRAEGAIGGGDGTVQAPLAPSGP